MRKRDHRSLRVGLEVRCGVHTGEIEMKGEDIGGIAVHIAARIAALAEGGQVLVSRTVRDWWPGSQSAASRTGHLYPQGLEREHAFVRCCDRARGLDPVASTLPQPSTPA